MTPLILYISADATGVPMRKEELEGRAGKQPDGTAKTRSAYRYPPGPESLCTKVPWQ